MKNIPFDEYNEVLQSFDVGHEDYFFIKANLPDSMNSYNSGNGEGMWVVIDRETKEEYEKMPARGTFFAYLANDSGYYPQLNAEVFNQDIQEVVPLEFEFRGDKRPVLAKSKLEELLS